jgi:endonuclease-3
MLMTPSAVNQFFLTLQKNNPNPGTELCYESNEQLLIAVILSAQSTDLAVNRVTRTLFSLAPTPKDIVELGEDGIIHHIRSLGLFRSKAKHVLGTCIRLCEDYEGLVPNNRRQLESLPGVGRKTANVILNTLFHEPCIAVDTHVFRVSNRTGLAPGKNVLDVERHLMLRIPSKFLVNAHHWLILHGRYICKAKTPLCEECPVFNECTWKK